MTEQHKNKVHVLVALDCIIFGFDENELKLLLINRGFEPEMGKCSLMGGFLRKDENLEVAAERVLYQLTGLKEVYMEQLQAFGAIYETSLDTRNFSKKLLSMGVLIKLQEKQKGFSRKGAFYYQFDQLKYEKSINNGLSFVIKT